MTTLSLSESPPPPPPPPGIFPILTASPSPLHGRHGRACHLLLLGANSWSTHHESLSVCKTRLIVHDSIIIRCIRCLVYLREQQGLPRNGLPSDVTSASSLSVFKNRLKTYLFRRCYETV